MALDAAGNVYVSGGFKGTVDFDPGPKDEKVTALAAGVYKYLIAPLRVKLVQTEALAERPRTISRSVEQLLLSVAQEMDERTQEADGRRGAAASRGARRDG